MLRGAVTLENTLAFPQKDKFKLTTQSSKSYTEDELIQQILNRGCYAREIKP